MRTAVSWVSLDHTFSDRGIMAVPMHAAADTGLREGGVEGLLSPSPNWKLVWGLGLLSLLPSQLEKQIEEHAKNNKNLLIFYQDKKQ